MKNKSQDPYSFNKSPEESKILSRDEQQMIEKKVFVERRYQTSRKIRDLPTQSKQTHAATSTTPTAFSANVSSPASVTSTTSSGSGGLPIASPSISSNFGGMLSSSSSTKSSYPNPKKGATTTVIAPAVSSTSPPENNVLPHQRRDSTGSFSSICSSSGDDKGIPKIALIQSSELIANYFQSAEPLPIPGGASTVAAPPIIHLNSHKHDGPPPMKMQKVGWSSLIIERIYKPWQFSSFE